MTVSLGTLDQLRRDKRRLVAAMVHEGVHGFGLTRLFPYDLSVFIEDIHEFFEDNLFIVFRNWRFRFTRSQDEPSFSGTKCVFSFFFVTEFFVVVNFQFNDPFLGSFVFWECFVFFFTHLGFSVEELFFASFILTDFP